MPYGSNILIFREYFHLNKWSIEHLTGINKWSIEHLNPDPWQMTYLPPHFLALQPYSSNFCSGSIFDPYTALEEVKVMNTN